MGYHSHMSSEQLRQVVEQLPRVKLAHLPTPLEECPRLAKELTPGETGPALYIKRDDMTGLGMGGNKARHLEFHLGRQAMSQMRSHGVTLARKTKYLIWTNCLPF